MTAVPRFRIFQQLGGGNSKIFCFHPESLGKWSYLTIIFFKWGWFNHQLENLVEQSVFVKSLICKRIWEFVFFHPYSWRSLYDYVVVEYGIFFSGNLICYQTCCMLGVGCNWRFGRCFGISRPWALSQIFCKEKGYSKCFRGHWNGNPMFPSKRKKNLRTKLGGGFKNFIFSPLLGEMVQFD